MRKFKSFGYISRKAKKLLLDCGVSIDSIIPQKNGTAGIDVKKIAECLGIRVIEYPFSENISGLFFKKDSQIFLGVNQNHPNNRKRFTIAHEIGHYLLHSKDILHYDLEELDKVYFRAKSILSREETEANFFAAEILMPDSLIDKCIDSGINSVEELAKFFEVSEEAMRYRLINLGYL